MLDFLIAPFKYPWKEASIFTKLLRYFYRQEHRQAAGVVIVNGKGRSLRVLLIHRIAPWNDWTFTKGSVEEGENDLERAAIREGREESGLKIKLIAPLVVNNYAFYADDLGKLIRRSVHYFLARSDNREVDLTKNPDSEEINQINQFKWVTFPEAIKMVVKHEEQKEMLTMAAKMV